MPPQISDDEASDLTEVARNVNLIGDKGEVKLDVAVEEEEEKAAESEDSDEEEIGEDEYVVEKITNHLVDEETGELRFEVKWEGYDKKSERTWEPEENLLETASKALNEYLESVGGKELILKSWADKKAETAEKKTKKRPRVSAGEGSGANGAKRGRKNGMHPSSATPPLSSSRADFKPPTGSWEDEVVAIDACEGTDSKVIVYLTWKGGAKSQHPLTQVYKRCPQKMLKFYESHLVFKKNDDEN